MLSDFCNQSKRYLASLLCTSQTTYITKRKINSSKKKSGQNIVQDSLIVSSFFKKTHTHKQGKIGAEHTRIRERERERESVCVCVCVYLDDADWLVLIWGHPCIALRCWEITLPRCFIFVRPHRSRANRLPNVTWIFRREPRYFYVPLSLFKWTPNISSWSLCGANAWCIKVYLSQIIVTLVICAGAEAMKRLWLNANSTHALANNRGVTLARVQA